jgi:hypothetical protein
MIALLCFFLTLFASPSKSRSRIDGFPSVFNQRDIGNYSV